MTSRNFKKCKVTGKLRHRDKVSALLALASIQRKDSTRRAKMEQRAYRCPHCGDWHLTSKK